MGVHISFVIPLFNEEAVFLDLVNRLNKFSDSVAAEYKFVLVEFALRLPAAWKLRHGEGKYLLKQLLFERVPAGLFQRPKRGFSVPLGRWLRGDLNYLMRYLDDDLINQTAVFDVSVVRNMKARFIVGEEYLFNRLWVLIIVQRFILQRMKVAQ